MEQSTERVERTYIKLSLGFLIGIILLIAVIWGGHDLYVRWQERRMVRVALAALQRGDERGASLAARTVLQLKPSSVGAARIVAQLGEREGDRSALDWRRKVALLQPQSTDDVLAWAKCALLFNDKDLAERVLAQVPDTGKETAGYHAVAALLAQARRQDEKAENEWAEAAQRAPEEKAYQLQLGLMRLRATDENRHASGVAILSALRHDHGQRLPATRALIQDAVSRHENAEKVIGLARELRDYPEATVNDRLILLDFLRQLNDPQFTTELTKIEHEVAEKPADLAALLEWMSRSNLNLLALNFVKTLPADTLEKWPVPLTIADIYARLKDWKKLETTLQATNWRQSDFLRHAYLARALRATDKPAAAEREWAAAAKGAFEESEQTLILLRTISEWGWADEAVDLLWTLSKRPDKQSEALATLYKHYAQTQDTQGLYRVMTRLAELDPANLDVKNNLAQIGLLLNAKPDEARGMAAEVYQKMPSNPAYATTYSYALLTKGDVKGALRIMHSLGEDKLADPPISAYYGLCLAAAKDARAREFLEAGKKATLLPEERALLDKSLLRLGPEGQLQ